MNWYLLNELTKNLDSPFNNSVYLVIGADGRLSMGPPWDFDLSMGNRKFGHWSLDDPNGWWLNRNTYTEFEPGTSDEWRFMFSPTQLWNEPKGQYFAVLMNDPWFAAKVKARWTQVAASLAGLDQYVAAQAEEVAESAALNFSPVHAGGAGQIVSASFLELDPDVFVFANSDFNIEPGVGWRNEVLLLKNWLAARTTWLNQQLGAN